MRLLVTVDATRFLPQPPCSERESALLVSLCSVRSLRMGARRSRCSPFVIQTGKAHRQAMRLRSR